jgi:hypothetical protein
MMERLYIFFWFNLEDVLGLENFGERIIWGWGLYDIWVI